MPEATCRAQTQTGRVGLSGTRWASGANGLFHLSGHGKLTHSFDEQPGNEELNSGALGIPEIRSANQDILGSLLEIIEKESLQKTPRKSPDSETVQSRNPYKPYLSPPTKNP